MSNGLMLCHLASGSAGNSLLVESHDESVLIDAGVSTKQIKLRMEKIFSPIRKIRGIIVTHEHSDHTKGVEVLSRTQGITVYINKQTYKAFLRKTGKELKNVCFFNTGEEIKIGNFIIQTFSIPHDAEDAVGITVYREGLKIGVATDLGHSTHLVRERLKGANVLVLESNHNVEQLMRGPYPWVLKQRIRGKEGHLSNEDALALLCHLTHKDLRHVIFSHVSDTNNKLELINKAFERWVPKNRQTFSFNVVPPNGMGTPYNITL